ncbi:MAG: AAA family ATPase [Bacillota bacterium]|nr:AAA family ATPase [Bacillota bacterium]
MNLENTIQTIKRIEDEVSRHILGQEKLVKDTLICLMAGGNMLLEGVPGLGKTKLVSSLAKALGLDFKRIQFTPDLMPADITGTNIFNRDKNLFEFQKGPVFTNILLADEINRATPKTQSAMLEAMQEKSVSVANVSYKLDTPYMVMATQNPIEQEGTYPLPEAQLDRFMFKLIVEFPDKDSLARIVNLTAGSDEEEVACVSDRESLLHGQSLISSIPVAAQVMDYAMKVILGTHPDNEFSGQMVRDYVDMGSSPRGAQALIKTARVKALMEGRYNVSFEDISYVAVPVLRHRIALNYNAMSDNVKVERVISEILERAKA